MSMITTLIWAALAFAGEFIPLQFHDETLDQPILVRVERDGSFLLGTQTRLYHWTHSGTLINVISGEEDSAPLNSILGFYYDIQKEIYWISHNDGFQSAFFDQKGRFLGVGFLIDETGKHAPVEIRSFVPTRNRVLATGMVDVDLWKNPTVPLLNQITYEVQSNHRVLVRKLGRAFYSISPNQLRYEYNYKLQWAVEDPYHGNLYVVDQMTPRIRHFIPAPEGGPDFKELEDEVVSISLPQYKPPPSGFSRIRNQNDLDIWLSSWTRVNGLYLYREDFIVGYNITDPGDPAKIKKVAQVITRRGRLVGKMLELNGDFIGVYNDLIHVFENAEEGPRIRVLDL